MQRCRPGAGKDGRNYYLGPADTGFLHSYCAKEVETHTGGLHLGAWQIGLGNLCGRGKSGRRHGMFDGSGGPGAPPKPQQPQGFGSDAAITPLGVGDRRAGGGGR